jgi:hypothetical protein
MNAYGAADLIAKIYGDDDDDEAIVNQPVYLGGPFVFCSVDSTVVSSLRICVLISNCVSVRTLIGHL